MKSEEAKDEKHRDREARSVETKTLTLLTAPAGYGKTHLCLTRFKELIQNAPDLTDFHSYYIVPTQEHAERIRDLILRDPSIPVIGGDHVTTFDSYVKNLTKETDYPQVTDVLKHVFVREILQTIKLDYFSASKDWPGFVELVSNFIGEVKETGMAAEEFNEAILTTGSQAGDAHRKKYRELANILKAYDERLRSEGLFDIHDAAQIFKNLVNAKDVEMPVLRDIFIDGFFEFTPAQRPRLVTKL